MNALEARSISSEINSNKIKAELNNIKKKISEAASNGEFAVDIYSIISKENNNLLKQEGFNIRSHTSGYNETATEISW